MLRQFVFVWILYWIAIAAIPVHSIYPATAEAFLLQASFVAIVALSAKTITDIFKVKQMPTASERDIPHAGTLIWVAIALSIIGLAALTYDKMFIQNIDYTAGIAFAREEWRRLGEDREGHASSIFSIIGYLLGSTYYIAAVLAITQGAFISARTRLLSLLACFLILMANSLLTGGRSNLLLIAMFIAGAVGSRSGITMGRLFARTAQRRILKLLVVIAAGYSLYVFFQRADAFELGAVQYAIDFLPYLGIEADPWFRHTLGDTFLSSISAIAVLAGSYLTHSFATVAAIVDTPTEDKSMIFLNVAQMLYKLGLISQPDDSWFLAGRFPSFPGALWHQFGPSGFVAGSVVLGLLSGSAKVWTNRRPSRLLPLGAYTMATATLLLTPALFAPDFLSFPFVAAGFLIIALASRMIDMARVKTRNTSQRVATSSRTAPLNPR